ncbi:MAG: hypothetical protein ACYCOU_24735 [Sulfobacillus sp.]
MSGRKVWKQPEELIHTKWKLATPGQIGGISPIASRTTYRPGAVCPSGVEVSLDNDEMEAPEPSRVELDRTVPMGGPSGSSPGDQWNRPPVTPEGAAPNTLAGHMRALAEIQAREQEEINRRVQAEVERRLALELEARVADEVG